MEMQCHSSKTKMTTRPPQQNRKPEQRASQWEKFQEYWDLRQPCQPWKSSTCADMLANSLPDGRSTAPLTSLLAEIPSVVRLKEELMLIFLQQLRRSQCCHYLWSHLSAYRHQSAPDHPVSKWNTTGENAPLHSGQSAALVPMKVAEFNHILAKAKQIQVQLILRYMYM